MQFNSARDLVSLYLSLQTLNAINPKANTIKFGQLKINPIILFIVYFLFIILYFVVVVSLRDYYSTLPGLL